MFLVSLYLSGENTCVPCCFRFKFVAVEGQKAEMVYGLVTEPKKEIYVHLCQREKLI